MANNDLIQAAVQTFCLVPEVYQQLMQQAGGEFPDELVSEVKSNPQEAMAAISEDQDLLKGIVTLYQENSEAINNAAASVTSQKQPLFKKGGKLYQAVQRFGDGGRAQRFYSRWTSGEILKLQNRLKAYGFDPGDLDGKIGPDTIAAVKAYQKAHNLKVDGMFGHNSNSMENLIDASTADKGRYTKNYKTEVGDHVKHYKDYEGVTVADVSPQDFQNFEVYYYEHPEELFDESNEGASVWRQILQQSGKTGQFYLDRIYGMVDPSQRKNISNRTKTNNVKSDENIDSIHETQNKVARNVGPILTTPVALGELLAGVTGGAALTSIGGLVGGLGGGLAGSVTGEAIGKTVGETKSKRKDKNGYTNVYNDPIAERYGAASAEYNPERQIQESGQHGRSIGAIVGGTLGSVLGAGASTDAQVAYLNRLNRGHANLSYKDPVVVVDGQMSPYGYVTTNSVGRGNAAVYAEGAVQPKVTAGSMRVGGPHGLTVNYNGTNLNPGSFANQDIVNAASAQWNNMNSPIIVKFGAQPNTGLSSKLGNSYVQNLRGVLLNAGMDAPAALITSDAVGAYKRGGNIKRYGDGKKLDLTKYNKTISAKGDTTEVKPYRERTDIRIARKNGPVIYQSLHKSWTDTYVDPSRGPLTGTDRVFYGNPGPVPEDVKSNWEAIQRNHQNDPNVLDKSKKPTKTNSKPNFVPAIGSLFGGLARPSVTLEDIKI